MGKSVRLIGSFLFVYVFSEFLYLHHISNTPKAYTEFVVKTKLNSNEYKKGDCYEKK